MERGDDGEDEDLRVAVAEDMVRVSMDLIARSQLREEEEEERWK